MSIIPSPAPTFNRQEANPTVEEIGQAKRSLVIDHKGDDATVELINRGYGALIANYFQFDVRRPDQLIIESSSKPNALRYHVTPERCECTAGARGIHCHHRYALVILQAACAIRRRKAYRQSFEALTAECDELFA
jgi:hypothetical protein